MNKIMMFLMTNQAENNLLTKESPVLMNDHCSTVIGTRFKYSCLNEKYGDVFFAALP
jgi:hypothetical protein